MSFKSVRIAPLMLSLLLILSSGTGCNSGSTDGTTQTVNDVENDIVKENPAAAGELKVTFVELGSVNCVPCRLMKPVIERVEKQYPGQVKVIFHDVWTDEGKDSGSKFGVRVIPTQVFLDSTGKEYYRHEGFFPFEEVDKILKQKGVN